MFLGSNTFAINFGDKIPATSEPQVLRSFSRIRTLHLRGWLSYLGDHSSNLGFAQVSLGLYKHDFDTAWLIDTFKDIKAAFPDSAIVTIAADITVQSLQTVGARAIPPMRVTTDAENLDNGLRALKHDVQRKKNWVTSRDESNLAPYDAAMWKHNGVKELERLAVKVEALFCELDGDGAWTWNGVVAK